MSYVAIIAAYAIGCLNVLPLATAYVSRHTEAARYQGYVAGQREGQLEAERRMDNGSNCVVAAYWAEGAQRVGVACTKNGKTEILGRPGI